MSPSPTKLALGPLMVDVEGTELSEEEIQRLRHPAVGGVVLFTRNFASRAQLTDLVAAIHALREPALVVAVDQEGGRVQRFRTEFTGLAPVSVLGQIYDRSAAQGRAAALAFGEVLGGELAAVGIDVNFAPVVDLGGGNQRIIGNRALHAGPAEVAELASRLLVGMGRYGVSGVAKHFPGHGAAEGDTHTEGVVDPRSLEGVQATDLAVYRHLIGEGLAAVMTAHVTYPAVDDRPATYSSRWLREILRGQLGFAGVVFSDDLVMQAAHTGGNLARRATGALAAGCDVVLALNEPRMVDALLDDETFEWVRYETRSITLARTPCPPSLPEVGLARETLAEALASLDAAVLTS